MKVLQVVPDICLSSAGTSVSVPGLCRGLSANGVDVELHTQLEVPFDPTTYKIFNHARSPFPCHALGRSPQMLQTLKIACKTADIIHANGNWMMPHAYMDWARKGTGCKLVMSPRGSFSPVAQARSRIKKAIVNAIGVKRAISHVDMFHATSEKELEEIRRLGYKQPVALIPIGIDMPDVKHKPFTEQNRKAIFLGRIHETKLVDHLVKAWGKVALDFPAWSLEIAGPDCGAKSVLEKIIEENSVSRVKFVDELKGRDKFLFYASADLYVLPSMTENFGITIAEALACGTPVIASKGCPWPGIERNRCGWWYQIGISELTDTLRTALATSANELADMGVRGKQWMSESFSWLSVGKRMRESYNWLLHGGDLPRDVKV